MIKHITDYLIKNNVISKDDQEIYDYGLFVVFFNSLSLLSIIILGMLFNDITYSLYLILFFVPIRTLLGGYHAKTPYTCFIFFNSLFIAVYYFTHLVSPSVLKDISLLLILISLTLYYKDHSKYKIILTLIVSVFIIIELLDLVPSLYISSAFFMSSFLYLINFPFQYFSCSRHNMI